jgi:peptide/nickel transport system permease protein
VLQDLLHAFPATLELATLALIIGAVLGVIAGCCAPATPVRRWI